LRRVAVPNKIAAVLFYLITFVTTLFPTIRLYAQTAEYVLVEKEIDDDHVIIARKNGERLLLEKWSLRFSPLTFEGKTFVADVSSLWVTIYFEDRDSIKWSIKENLGRISRPRPGTANAISATPSKEVLLLVQAALTLLGYQPGPLNGIATPETTSAIKLFQKAEELPETGKVEKTTLMALTTRLYRRYPDNDKVLDVAAALLALSANPSTDNASSGVGDAEIIDSYIRGDFKGWDGDTLFLLDNGQIWQQSSYAYTYHYAYHPRAIIYKTDSGYKLMVDGVGESITVKRIR